MDERRPSAWDNAMPFRELLIMVVGAISLVRAVLWLAFGHSKPGWADLGLIVAAIFVANAWYWRDRRDRGEVPPVRRTNKHRRPT